MSYYETLYLPTSASQDEIKESYQKLIQDNHPDKKSGNQEAFLELNEAYKVLSVKEKRSFYNFFGKAGLKLFKNAAAENVLCAILSCTALKLFVIAAFLFILSTALLPMLFALKNVYRLFEYNSFCVIPFCITYFAFLVYVNVAIKALLKKNLKSHLSVKMLVFIAVALFLLLFAILCGFMYVDFDVKTNLLHTMPFLLFNSFLLFVEVYVYVMNNKVGLYEIITEAVPRFLWRYIIGLIFFIDVDFKYKLFIPVLFLIYESLIREISPGFVIIALLAFFSYVLLIFLTFCSYRMIMFYSFLCFYAGFSFSFYKLLRIVISNMPKSVFLKQKMLMYHEKCIFDFEIEDEDAV